MANPLRSSHNQLRRGFQIHDAGKKKSLLDAEPEARISPKIRGYICVKSMLKVWILGQVLTTIGGSVQ